MIDSLGSEGIVRLMKAMEITITGNDYFTTITRWSKFIHRKYFVYHLWRLDLRETAEKIIIGAYTEYQQQTINFGEQ